MVTESVKLSKLQLRNIARICDCELPAPNDTVTPGLIMCVLTADMLLRLRFLSSEQRELILNEMRPAREAAIHDFAQLVFADGNHCTWTGNTGFINLESGEQVTALTIPPMETISYNLNEMYKRGTDQITKRRNYAKRQNDAGAVDESPDVCERAADGVS